MGSICVPENAGGGPKIADQRKQQYYESESDTDSDYDEEDPGHTPQPSREEMEEDAVRQGFIKAFEDGNDGLAIHLADEYPELDMMSYEFENGENCLMMAVSHHNDKLVVFCLEEGIDVNAQNKKTEETALHMAVRLYNLRIAALLMNFGADPMIENKKDESAITIAHELDDFDMLELLKPEVLKQVRSISLEEVDQDEPPKMLSAELAREADDILEEDDEPLVVKRPAILDKKKSSKAGKTYEVDSHFEKALDNDPRARLKMEAQRVQRNNPFTKLKRQNTVQALKAMQQIQQTTVQLPKLEGWLEKQRKKRGTKTYQRRWVVVKGSHMLWSDKQRTIHDPKSKKQRDQFNNYINIMSIRDILPVKTKSANKFSFVTGAGKQKMYIWKAASTEDRDHWVKGLRMHQDHVKSMINYLGSGGH